MLNTKNDIIVILTHYFKLGLKAAETTYKIGKLK